MLPVYSEAFIWQDFIRPKLRVPLNCGRSQAARPGLLDRELCGLYYKIALNICTKERCLDAAAGGGGLAISIGKQYF